MAPKSSKGKVTKAITTTKKASKAMLIKAPPLETRYPEQLNIIYSNHANFLLSGVDLSIDFGIKHPQIVKNKQKDVVQINSRIIMSIQQTKIFLSKLQGLVELYEKDFGKIVTEPKKK
jgi:hypothetical protein